MTKHEVVGQALVVTLEGELDLHTAPPFKEYVDKQLNNVPSVKDLILDLQDVTFIDSSGLGVILGRYKSIEARNGKLIFVNLRPQVKRVLELSGFKKIAKFVNSTREALEEV